VFQITAAVLSCISELINAKLLLLPCVPYVAVDVVSY
jgi:hypothetical protein